MSRVINTNSPGKLRNQQRRVIAELLRSLGQKAQIDTDAQDMVATIVVNLLEIWEGVDQTAQAWEKRGYWLKAERFLREWEWTKEAAANLDDVIRHQAWDLIPELLAMLFPRFADVEIKRSMVKPEMWQGAHARLLAAPPLELPY
jgi:hypothetical protein